MQLRILFLFAFTLSYLSNYGQSFEKSYPMVKVSNLAGDDWTCSSINVPQVMVSLRSFNPISLRPAISLGGVFYNDCDGGKHTAFMMHAGMITNVQFLKAFHLRNQLFLGAQTSSLQENNRVTGEATLGAGLTLWRIESSFDFGIARYEGQGYFIYKLGVGYVFSTATSLNPKGIDWTKRKNFL